jgi:hypothetical protein
VSSTPTQSQRHPPLESLHNAITTHLEILNAYQFRIAEGPVRSNQGPFFEHLAIYVGFPPSRIYHGQNWVVSGQLPQEETSTCRRQLVSDVADDGAVDHQDDGRALRSDWELSTLDEIEKARENRSVPAKVPIRQMVGYVCREQYHLGVYDGTNETIIGTRILFLTPLGLSLAKMNRFCKVDFRIRQQVSG